MVVETGKLRESTPRTSPDFVLNVGVIACMAKSNRTGDKGFEPAAARRSVSSAAGGGI